MEDLLKDIETFIAARQMSPTMFGAKAAKDPNFLFELRGGREVLPRTEKRIRQFMLTYDTARAL